ncbi:hypothetical protein [Erwinia billingiae]|uniref:hypothetical protein n=1 Tax=Erwinia billingiae TaxID=182337 RepID=UPI0032095AE5
MADFCATEERKTSPARPAQQGTTRHDDRRGDISGHYMASERAGTSQLQGLPLQSDRSRQAGNWRSPVPRSFSADFPPGSGVGLTTGPRSGSGAEGCHDGNV